MPGRIQSATVYFICEACFNQWSEKMLLEFFCPGTQAGWWFVLTPKELGIRCPKCLKHELCCRTTPWGYSLEGITT